MNIGMNKLIVLSGPSGVGKDSTIRKFLHRNSEYQYLIPFTTRKKRIGEIDGRDYNFVSLDTFDRMFKSELIYEWDYVLGNYYGFLTEDFVDTKQLKITHSLARMALRLKASHNEITTVFIKPDDYTLIHKRLENRKESNEVVERLRHGVEEEIHARLFDLNIESMNTDVIVTEIESFLFSCTS